MGISLFALAILGLGAPGLIPVLALPSGDYVLHEMRGGGMRSKRWKRSGRVDGNAILPLRIGLSQSNLDQGYDLLMGVSDPTSATFGKHYTADEVTQLFAPKQESHDAVKNWLLDEGIAESSIIQYANKGWLGVDLPAVEVERLFLAQFYEHEHDGVTRLGCESYHVPRYLRQHIDYITPGVKMSPPMVKREVDGTLSKRAVPTWGKYGAPHRVPVQKLDAPWALPEGAPALPPNVRDCSTNFTDVCYRALYGIPANETAQPGNELGFFESGDTYSQQDLDAYYHFYTPYIANGTGPIPQFVDGAEAPVDPGSEYNTGESDIDFSIAIPLIWPQKTVLYQVDDRPQSTLEGTEAITGFLNTFLDALDGSYCNYTAYGITGDSPGIDAQYPDDRPGGYKGQRQCGVYTPTRVISISYGQSEADLPKPYTQRQCNEWMKLGLQGTTVLVASGDYGVGSFAGDLVGPNGCLSGCGQNGTIYSADYPGGCPYITSVGATQLQPSQTINDPESALQTPLGNGSLALFASGGGFSNYFPRPRYQDAAVETYLAEHDPGHPYYTANKDSSNIGAHGGIYNRAGRGFPDISANGANFRAFTNLTRYHNFGTSLAAPLWGSVITLINQQRQVAGKGPVGFINPVLYANPSTLTDIKNGSNPNCGTSGFSAVAGWDPITGLGTPKYPDLLALWLSLP